MESIEVPVGFGTVEKHVFRSNMPQTSHLGFLKQLHIKCMLLLSPERPTRDLLAFIQDNGIDLVRMILAQ